MKIKSLKKLNSGKYKVTFDDNSSINLFDEVILDNNLLYKKELTLEDLNEINNQNEYYNVYSKVLKYIMIKMRSLLEIKKYMDKLSLKKEEQDKIINKLKSNNLINDNLFAQAYIADKVNLSNDGPFKIKKDLEKHNIDDFIIDEELSKYENEIFINKLEKIINKKVSSNHKDSLFKLKQKILNQLINLGYSKEMITNILNNIKVNTNDILEKEYDKAIKKLSKKYSEDKLYYEVRNYLYKKGFSIDEINSIKKSD